MRCRSRITRFAAVALALILPALRADPNDVENSHDYPGFPRMPGFVITDYDEDNPAEFDFPVARPLPIDASHVETVHVRGHRYAIRYEISGGHAPTLLQTQEYYEKLAANAGFMAEKTGAVGDVTETFYRDKAGRGVWVYLEPGITSDVLTVVEADGSAPPSAPTPASAASRETSPEITTPAVVHETASAQAAPAIAPNGDLLYAELMRDGRVALPIVFLPNRETLDDASQPQIDRIIAMMKQHPEIYLRIEGHTDNSGHADDNLRLSAQRAFAVEAVLAEAGIDKSHLDAVGVGGLQPIADNHTAAGREKNRRIELVLRKKFPSFHSSAPNGNNYYPGGQ